MTQITDTPGEMDATLATCKVGNRVFARVANGDPPVRHLIEVVG